MADFVWKWLKNELPTVLVCLPDGANQGNKVVKHRDPTPHSNRCNRINSHSGLLALIDTSNAKDLSRLYNKGKLVFSVLDSQVFIVLNQCSLQFALKVCYLDLLRYDFVACLEIVARFRVGSLLLVLDSCFPESFSYSMGEYSQKAFLPCHCVCRCSVTVLGVGAASLGVMWCGVALSRFTFRFCGALKGLDICIHHS